jgi:hypothetical protein
MTATHPHRMAGGDRGIDQPGLRRWFRARGGLTTSLLVRAGSAGLLVAANACWTGKRGDDTRGSDCGPPPPPARGAGHQRRQPIRSGRGSGPRAPTRSWSSPTKELVFAHYLTPLSGAMRARGIHSWTVTRWS